jgi:lipoprotein-releasing system ATP-binding protein
VDLTRKSSAELASFRSQTMGFVFQFHHLLPEFTALENILLPCRIAGDSRRESLQKAEALLNRMGMKDRKDHYPSQLSGGEQQRVAIARALIRGPRILFADEPTGNLDSTNAKIIQDLFFQLKQEQRLTLVVVTHDQNFAGRFPRRLELKDGMWVSYRF